MNVVMKQLVLKDLRMNRTFIAMAIGIGTLGLALSALGATGFSIGAVLYITASLGSGILIAMYCVVQERKDQAHLFAISLPLTMRQLGAAKFIGALASYLIVWLVLTLLGIVQPLIAPRAPDGVLVYTLVIQGFQFAICCAFLGLVVVTRSEARSGIGIFAINVTFCLFMVLVNQPRFRAPITTEAIVWTPFAVGMLAFDAVATVLAIVLAFFVLSRRREF